MVERDGDAWTLVIATPSDSRTGRYTWVGGKWGKNTHGYRATVAFYESDASGAPRAEAPVEVPAVEVVPDPVADAEERAEAEAAEAFRIKATRAHDRVAKGHKRVVTAAERAGKAWERAEAAQERANAAEAAESERAHVRVAEADALMWSHTPGTAEYRAAFGEFLTARFDAENLPAAEAAEEAADHAERARAASADEWETADGETRTGAGTALETADHARAEVMIEYGTFERSTPAGRFDAETACDIICGHARDMSAAVRHAEAAADAAEAAADQAEEWADAAETEADAEADALFSLGTADRRQVALARAHWGVSDVVAEAVTEAAETATEAAERRSRVAAAEERTEAQRTAERPAERETAQRAAECAEAAEAAAEHSGRAAEAYEITRDLMLHTWNIYAARPVENLPPAEGTEARALLRLLDRRSRVAHDVDYAARCDWYDGSPITDPQRSRDCANRARILADGCEAHARRVAELFAWEEHAKREAAAEEERLASLRMAEEELARAEERARNQTGYPSPQARRIGEGNARRAVQNARCALAEKNGRPFVALAEISSAGHDQRWYVVDASRGRRIIASGFGCMAEAESDAARRNEERAAEEAAAAAAVRRARRRVEEAEEKAAEARRRAEGLDAAAGVHYGRFAGGQPILMGHHSARGALRDRARGDAATRKAIEATAEAERAESAARKARQEAELAETAHGRSRPWERADFQRGDVVEVRKIYTASYVVVRANAKTLTLRNAHTIDDVKGRYDQVLSRTRDGQTITNPGQDDAPSVKEPALSEELDEDTTTTRQAPAGVGGFSRELDANASTEEAAPEPVLGTGNPDDSARVVLCWDAAGAGALDRWEVTASWRGHGFRVAQHKGEWFITREQMHPADLSKNPKQWRKGEQVRHADRRPIRSRVEAEALMIARVEERRGREAEVHGIIKAAAEGPAPKWTPAPSIIKPRKAPRADWSPSDVLAEWGDSVSYEEIAEEEAEDVAPLDAAAGHPALVECQAAADLLVAYAEEHPLDEAAEGWAFEAVERVAMCAWAVEEEDEERAGEYARAAKGERAALTLGRLDEAGPMTPERLATLDADTLALLRWYAGPWPVRWLWPPEKDAPRVINLFHGPGGWSVGIRDVLGATVDMVGVDLDPGAVATAEAAGFEMIRASVTDLDPECPALQWVTGIILSPPCQAFSPAGLRMGRYASAIELIVSVVRGVGAAAGFLALVDAEGRDAGTAPRSGESWEDVRAPLAELDDPRAGLMAEVVVWPLAMLARGGSVEWVAVEQSSALPSEIERGLINEFVQAGWGTVEAETLDAVRYGAASHRKRRFLTAHRTRSPFVSVHPTEAFPVTTFAECAGWERGRSVNTRGQRGTDPKTGRPKGGNAFSADRPSTCVTATAYGWKDDESGEKVTQATIGRLVGFPGDYPWKHVGRGAGIRNRAQQAADAVCPMVAAAIIGRALDVEEWERRARAYADALYRRSLRPEAPLFAIVPRPRPAVPVTAEAPAAASTTSAASARGPLPAAAGGPAPAAGAPVLCLLSRRADAGGSGGVRAGHSARQGATRQPTRQGTRQPTAPGAGSRGPPLGPGVAPACPWASSGKLDRGTSRRDNPPRPLRGSSHAAHPGCGTVPT
ncbi:DNA cytosine methyltransferase [Streptomyces albidoflavus]